MVEGHGQFPVIVRSSGRTCEQEKSGWHALTPHLFRSIQDSGDAFLGANPHPSSNPTMKPNPGGGEGGGG